MRTNRINRIASLFDNYYLAETGLEVVVLLQPDRSNASCWVRGIFTTISYIHSLLSTVSLDKKAPYTINSVIAN
jgi:uncharacterized membrane protein YwaF